MAHVAQQQWMEPVLAQLRAGGAAPLITFFQRQRWFGGKGRPLMDLRVVDAVPLSEGGDRYLLALMQVEYRGGLRERYVTPLTVTTGKFAEEGRKIMELPDSAGREWFCDATADTRTWSLLYEIIAGGKDLVGYSGSLQGRATSRGIKELVEPPREVKLLSTEQSNTSVMFDRRCIMKLIRKAERGLNPDSEIVEFLTTRTDCRDVPPLYGTIAYLDEAGSDADAATIVMLQRFVPNEGDGWRYVLGQLDALLNAGCSAAGEAGEDPAQTVARLAGPCLAELRRLGESTGRLHLALSSREDPEAMRPEPITARDVEQWRTTMTRYLAEVCRELRALPAEQQAAVQLSATEIDTLEAAWRDRFADLRLLTKGKTFKTRHHGDYHLGQVLKIVGGFVVIDFEGEPARALEERRAKVCPLKDVAGMLRSFNYAANAVLKEREPVPTRDVRLMREWERAARRAFLGGYRSVAEPGQAAFLPAAWGDTLRIIEIYELDKALYELRYEMRNRPGWLTIPLEGVRTLLRPEGP